MKKAFITLLSVLFLSEQANLRQVSHWFDQ